MQELYISDRFIFKALVDKEYEYDLHIEIISDNYAGQGYFSFYPELLKKVIIGLEDIYSNLEGEYIMRDEESEEYFISFKMKNNGSICVNGKIGDFKGNLLEFSNNADQTLIGNLLTMLKR